MDIRDFAGIFILFIFADIIFYLVVMKGLLVKSITGLSPADELRDREAASGATFILELHHTPTHVALPTRRSVRVLSGHLLEGNVAEPLVDLNALMRQEVANLSLSNIRYTPPRDLKVGEIRRLKMHVTQDIVETITKALNQACPAKIATLKIGALLNIILFGENFSIDAVEPVERRLGVKPDLVWAWDIMPLKSGHQSLGLDLALDLAIANGEIRKVYAWPPSAIKVAANPGYAVKMFLRRHWKSSLAMLLITLLAAGYLWLRY